MKHLDVELQRREFLKKAGFGSLALAAGPLLSHLQAAPALADDDDDDNDDGDINFHFLAGSGLGNTDIVLMFGNGKFSDGKVKGGGLFQHFNVDPAISGPPPPRPIVDQGTWKAKDVDSWVQKGTYGIGVSGVLTLDIKLRPLGGSSIPAKLEVTCNIPAAGLFTGNDEGFVLTVQGGQPFVPAFGITWFTNPDADDDDD